MITPCAGPSRLRGVVQIFERELNVVNDRLWCPNGKSVIPAKAGTQSRTWHSFPDPKQLRRWTPHLGNSGGPPILRRGSGRTGADTFPRQQCRMRLKSPRGARAQKSEPRSSRSYRLGPQFGPVPFVSRSRPSPTPFLGIERHSEIYPQRARTITLICRLQEGNQPA